MIFLVFGDIKLEEIKETFKNEIIYYNLTETKLDSKIFSKGFSKFEVPTIIIDSADKISLKKPKKTKKDEESYSEMDLIFKSNQDLILIFYKYDKYNNIKEKYSKKYKILKENYEILFFSFLDDIIFNKNRNSVLKYKVLFKDEIDIKYLIRLILYNIHILKFKSEEIKYQNINFLVNLDIYIYKLKNDQIIKEIMIGFIPPLTKRVIRYPPKSKIKKEDKEKKTSIKNLIKEMPIYEELIKYGRIKREKSDKGQKTLF